MIGGFAVKKFYFMILALLLTSNIVFAAEESKSDKERSFSDSSDDEELFGLSDDFEKLMAENPYAGWLLECYEEKKHLKEALHDLNVKYLKLLYENIDYSSDTDEVSHSK